jgi:two-component system, chemotaxis family, protein-glutamate methylesterase/glutaminase
VQNPSISLAGHHFVFYFTMVREKSIVVIGVSAGGSMLLPALIKQFTEDMNIVVLVVMHLSKRAIGEMLVSRLQKATTYTCKIPRHGETLKTRHIYVAKPDYHLAVKGNKILVGNGPMENRYRPSVDTLFRSAAAYHGQRAIGIVLTGMLEDGAAGMLAIRRAGGVCIIQDPGEAKYPDMPMAVLNQLKPDFAVPVSQMGEVISRVLKRKKKRAKHLIPADIVTEARIAERVQIGIDVMKEIGTHSLFSCPECGGGLWEMNQNGISRYRCHVGHAFTSDGLLSAMESGTESALWTALRIIEERRNLLQKIEAREKQNGNRRLAESYHKRIAELERQITHLKNALFATARD